MYKFDHLKHAVCDEQGNKVLIETDWTIDKELYAQLNHDQASWNLVAILKEVIDPDGLLRLGWEVVRIAHIGHPTQVAAPTDAITKALKAFGYGNGRGHDDDVPVVFKF